MARARDELHHSKAVQGHPSGMTPEQMSLRGRMGAHAIHARYDSKELTRNARKAFLDRFEREVDPDGTLPVAERQRRAQHARKAYFSKLAMRSAKVRRERKKR